MGAARFTSSVALGPRELPHASARIWRRVILDGGLPLLMSLTLVGAATMGLLTTGRFFQANLAPIVYLIPVMVAAAWWGTWPAVATAIGSTAAADFFFYPPYYSFRLDDTQAAIDLSLFLLVALVSGDLASRLRRETQTLRRRENELQYLYGFSRRLAACHTITDLVEAIQDYLTETFGRHTALFIPASTAASRPAVSDPLPGIIRNSVAAMMKPGEAPSRIVRDEEKNNIWLLRTVTSADTPRGVIAVDLGNEPCATIGGRRRRVEAILGEASQTLQRLDIGGAMEEASHHSKGQLLRDAFHGDLSHELRSP